MSQPSIHEQTLAELAAARACVKRLRVYLRIEKEEHARTMAVLTAFRQARDEEPSGNPNSLFEKLFR